MADGIFFTIQLILVIAGVICFFGLGFLLLALGLILALHRRRPPDDLT